MMGCSKTTRFIFGILILAYIITNFYLSNVVIFNNANTPSPPPGSNNILQSMTASTLSSTTAIGYYDYQYWPPLNSIIDFHDKQNPYNVIGNPQFLLDFVIAGHGKCGTTSIAEWLGSHPHVVIPEDEMLDLTLSPTHPTGQLIYRLYTELKMKKKLQNDEDNSTTTVPNSNTLNKKMIRGYKSPGEIRSPRSIRLLHQHFPNTVLIVGIRHPVLWFESLFNFKVQNLRPNVPSNYWGNPNELIGKCPNYQDFYCVGTAKGLFHVHLAQLGKTMSTSGVDVRLDPATLKLQETYPILRGNITQTSNPVFLFDIEQISSTSRSASNSTSPEQQTQLQEDHEQRLDIFRQDIERVLGLKPPNYPPLSTKPPKHRPGKTLLSKRKQRSRDKHKIDICKEKFLPLRTELMKISKEISSWLQQSGFLNHPHVTISSRDYFINVILNDHYMNDPCDLRSSSPP